MLLLEVGRAEMKRWAMKGTKTTHRTVMIIADVVLLYFLHALANKVRYCNPHNNK
ncbi:uncharacterized protein DS421_8g236560 [Arachis hypogaea]|nr:uncharacterized protein DS421_8g236560 [Arachis hypogaea]